MKRIKYLNLIANQILAEQNIMFTLDCLKYMQFDCRMYVKG